MTLSMGRCSELVSETPVACSVPTRVARTLEASTEAGRAVNPDQ